MSGVIYIGDRYVGKTNLAMRLSSKYEAQYVEVVNTSEEELKEKPYIYNSVDGILATQSINSINLELKVKLPVPVRISVDWVDTPGEMWREEWQKNNNNEWQQFLKQASTSKGVMLVLPPHRDLTKDDEFITLDQWCNRFDEWVDFFVKHCRNAEHVVLCLNKADLFCSNLDNEAIKLAYSETNTAMSWPDRNKYILEKYFAPIRSKITTINRHKAGLSVRCFITSIKNRYLLELPWIYLAHFLPPNSW
jgi:GTP-binding protein EngB required for normal cell division